MEKAQYILELNQIFNLAKASENWGIALRTYELLAKSQGWLSTKNQVMSITDYPLAVLEKWLAELEALDRDALTHAHTLNQSPTVAHHKMIAVNGRRDGS